MDDHKLLLFSDLHLRPESEEICFKVLEGVWKEANIQNTRNIAFLGDFFHLRYQIPVYLLNKVAEWVKLTASEFELILLPGNHDQVNENGDHALEVFQECGARVYSTPTIDAWGAWMPYRKDRGVVATCLTNLSESSNILFGHLPVLGAMMNNKMADKDGLSVDHFTKFDHVILGHYHKRQTFLEKIHYVGSPWQTRSDEAGQLKGFAVWDRNSGKLTYRNKKFGPRYHRFEFETAEDIQGQLELLFKTDMYPDPQDVITLVASNKKSLELAISTFKNSGYTRVVGNCKDEAIPQPRYGFVKNTPLSEYAKAYALDKGKDVASVDELMNIWGKLQ